MLNLKRDESELLESILRYLEKKVNPDRQQAIRNQYVKALNWKEVETLPLAHSYPLPKERISGEDNLERVGHSNDAQASLDWIYSPEKRFYDPEKMLLNQLLVGFGSIYFHNELRDDLPFTIRGNFGTVIVPSVYGAEVRFTEGNTPWASGERGIDYYLDKDPYDFEAGIYPRVSERYKYYREILSNYSNLQESIALVLPDLQGPLEVAASLLGEELYLKLAQDPKKVWRFLRRISETIVGLAKEFEKLTKEHLPEGYTHQHGAVIKGNILIREDSAINLSANMYREQVLPHNEFIIEELSGGGVHFCGDGEHLVDEMASSSHIQCIDLGQPKLMDLEKLYKAGKENHTPLIRVRFSRDSLLEEDLQDEFPTGLTLRHRASSMSEAKKICKKYYR